MNKYKGFTLLELMIVLGIIGLLCLFGFSSYEQIILKSRRIDARTTLLDYHVRLQHCFIENPDYLHCAKTLKLLTPQISLGGFYEIILTHILEKQYQLSGTARNTQKKDINCYRFTINERQEQNAYTQGGKPNSVCW